ncbi:hypothetical protein BKA59DRAFT_495800 [Fusarium tricinctum]|uniref:Peptidase metallopeptidase domain-containing protein n=1 Tax=Fusarium tricinctum TaxID=61284 RepID=A0A8K0RVS6_9HYPO|nr:hypothetical protein BKA59DRAFT_495800 [Fusarium tricinctum]
MATVNLTSQFTKYPYNTQEEEIQAIPNSLVIGFRPVISRWDINPSRGRKLQYFITAIDQESTHFYLVCQRSREGSNTLARAFFPHKVDQDVIDFERALEDRNVSILKNIFQHEIGHILGLRHDFTVTHDTAKRLWPEKGAVQFLKNDYLIQESDREQTIEFYKLANGFMIGGNPVTDFQSRVHSRN